VLALAHLGSENWGHHTKEISRLEHELSEASGNLKQSFANNTKYAERLARADTKQEIVEGRVAELERQVAKMVTKMVHMKKVVEEENNKNSVLHAENSELKAEKGAVEAKLDRNIDETLELLNQSFFQVVRKAYVFYNGPPSSNEFDPEGEVFEGRILPRAKVRALESATQPAVIEGAEGEDQQVLGF